VALVERALRADIERKVQKILHSTFGYSTFGYVQDDESIQGIENSPHY
jgi:hypothetical protein